MVSSEDKEINGLNMKQNKMNKQKGTLLGWSDFICLFILFFVIIICYMKLPWIAKIGQDGGDGHYAVWAMNARLLHEGQLPLWNPYGWGGYCGVGHIHEVFYPILVILEFLFWNSAKGYLSYMILPVYTMIHVLIFALGLYLLIRIAGKSGGVSSLVSAMTTLLVTFSGSMFIVQNWPYISGGIYWTPFLLLLLYKMIETRKNRYVVISGLCFAMLALASTAQGLVFAVINYFLVFIAVSIRDLVSGIEYDTISKRDSTTTVSSDLTSGSNNFIQKNSDRDELKKHLIIWGQDILRFIASGFIGMGIAAVEIFPFLETSALAYRYLPGIDMHETVTRIPISYFRESAIGLSGTMSIFGTYVDGYWSLTMVLLFFAVYGFFMVRSDKRGSNWFINAMKLMFVFGLLYTFKYGLVDLLQFVPILNSNRELCLYAPFIVLSCGVLAAEAIEKWIYGSDKYIRCELVNEQDTKKRIESNSLDKAGLGLAFVAMMLCFIPSHIKGPLDIVTKVATLIFVILGFYLNRKRCNKNGDDNHKLLVIKKFIPILFASVVVMTTITFWNQHLIEYGNMTPDMATKHADDVNDATRDVLLEADGLVKDKDDTARYIAYSSEPVLPGNIGFVTGDKNVTAYVNPIYKKTYYGYQMLNLVRQIQFENIKYIIFSGDAPEEEIEFFETYLGGKTVLLEQDAYSSYNATNKSPVRFMDVSDINFGTGWLTHQVGFYHDSDTIDGYATDTFIQMLNSETFAADNMAFVNADTVSDLTTLAAVSDNEINVAARQTTERSITERTITEQQATKQLTGVKSDDVKVTSYEANKITYQVDAAEDGILVTTETYYPGWHVLVDGHEQECIEANYKFRAVKLDRGVHEVTFYYAPTTVKFGVVTLVMAVLLSIILLIKEH